VKGTNRHNITVLITAVKNLIVQKTLVSSGNNRLGWKKLSMKNALAYNRAALVTAEEIFIVEASRFFHFVDELLQKIAFFPQHQIARKGINF
jgi:hypothetical protein